MSRDDRQRRALAWSEGMAALVLSTAALLTSWAGFQAALWDGEQAAYYTRAGAARVEAGLLATENGQGEAIDLFLFTEWLDAHARGDAKLDGFYRARFRPAFAHAFDAWLATDPIHNPKAPRTPFATGAYVPERAREARSKSADADRLFEQGQRANEISDHFVQATVILALALFMGGIGQTFKIDRLRLLLNGLAGIACILGLFQLISLPVRSL